MMGDKDYSPLPSVCVKALNDKLYEKRKTAALEIEKLVKDFMARGEIDQVKKLLKVLGQDFALSHNPHSRKGGLIGLAAIALALGPETESHVPELIQPILACFSDSDLRVRYYACESLYNVVKVARGAVLPHFTDIFNGLSRLAADPDQNVKNASELLDRLMKDIVTENVSFDLIAFMPTLREKILTRNDFARQFIISWIAVLHTVPEIDVVIFLPELLDGLFRILEDPKTEIKTICCTLLQEFLHSIKEDPSRVDFPAMNNIVIIHCQSQDELLQFTALTWLKEFVTLSKHSILPFTSGILTAVLPCLSYEADSKQNIKDIAKSINTNVMLLINENDKENTSTLNLDSVCEVIRKFLQQAKVPTKVAVLKWIYHLNTHLSSSMSQYIPQLFPILIHVLSDASDKVVQQALEVLAGIVSSESEKEKYFGEFIKNLIQLFSDNRKLLENRGSFIIRELCVLIDAEEIYRAFSKALLAEKNFPFASTMVDYLNTILLTSAELFELRTLLKDLPDNDSKDLFKSLYVSWCHNPVATVALCLLSQNYQHACDLIQLFGNLETTVEFLTEIDKLVQLIESPIFAYMRLHLLDVSNNQQLVKALYGLLMLLPQTEAFHTLRNRLACVPHLHLTSSQIKTGDEKDFDFQSFLKHFNSIQEQHRKHKLEDRHLYLLEKSS